MKSSNFKNGFGVMMLVFLFTMNISAQSSERRQKDQKPPSFSELLKMMDTDKDGKLSAKEVKGPLKDDFKKIDLNEDGFITEKELEKAPKPKRKERQRNN
jgi:Ca2+-binding EF-hand superfamily protein